MKVSRFCLRLWLVCAVLASLAAPRPVLAAEPDGRLDLAGDWSLRLDPQDVGVDQRWYEREFSESVRLPGSLQAQGFGNDVSLDTPWTGSIVDQSWFESPRYEPYRRPGNIKVPFWLQPEKHYVGPAWYRREVTVPQDWSGKRMVLSLERCHWETTLWVNGRQIGSRNSLSTPHEYDLTFALVPGPSNRKTHVLTIRVDNRIRDVNVGQNSHSVADHTQTNWNGVIGRLTLRATDRVWIDDVEVTPQVARKAAKFTVTIGNLTRSSGRGRLVLKADCFNSPTPHSAPETATTFEFSPDDFATVELVYPLGEQAQFWDEFHPALYRMSLGLEAETREQQHADEARVTFGMREIGTRGTQFVLNGRPVFLRGTLECSIFPLTGYPPTDVDAWRRIIRICQAHGLNHMRFHSWCPPEAAFAAADELGFYFQVECASWANQGASIGNGGALDRWLYDEADRILRHYGNHPSFVLMAYGNEPAGPGRGAKFLGPWVTHYRDKDPRRLYTSAAGWPLIPESQFHNPPGPRIHAWGAGLDDRINGQPPETVSDYREFLGQHKVPVVSHEIGQWCVYPNFAEMDKYTGVLKPKNFEIFREFLENNHMGDQARAFLMASGKLQTLCYKEEIEAALRTPGFGGFQLLDLHDFPGQGSALIGVLDPFWDSKPYVTPEEFRRFCGQTVPLARLPKRIFTTADVLEAQIDVSHFGPTDLTDTAVTWTLSSEDGDAVASGRLPVERVATGSLSEIGSITAPLADVSAPQKLRLVVGLEGTSCENDWDVWVYPAQVSMDVPEEVLVAHHLGDEALTRLRAGGKVLLAPPPKTVQGDVAIGFSSIFWNTAWTRNQPPHTLGILCDPRHPALADFPTEYHSNWQWWELISRSGAMVLDDLPPQVRPIVQVIDTWFEARRLGLVFEAKVAGGKLLVCSMDLTGDLNTRPVARQMRHSLLRYMAGEKFAPQVDVSAAAIRGLFRPPSKMEQLGATVTADSEQPGYAAAHVLDGDPATIWHTAWGDRQTAFPHHLIIDLKKPIAVSGIACVPRQDMANGRIADFAIYLSDDARNWGQPIVAGTWPNTARKQVVRFPATKTARHVKLVAKSEVNGNDWASVAEVEIVTP